MDALARAKERDITWKLWYDRYKKGEVTVREVAKAMEVETKTVRRKFDIWALTE